MIARTCNFCQETFDADPREVRRGNAKFCSRECSSKGRARRQVENNVTCALCNKEFYMSESKKLNSKSGLFFCCRSHKDQAQRLGGIKEIMPHHYGTAREPEYRKLAISFYGQTCMRCGYDRVPGILEVNHINLDRSDNSLGNLEVLCPNCHQEFHYALGTGRYAKKKL